MKIAIVTGASSGMGRELALRIAKEYQIDELWAVARGREALEALQGECNVRVRPIPLDLTREESLDRLKELLQEERPELSVLVNASGFGIFDSVENTGEEDLRGMIALNCTALTLLTRVSAPYLCKESVVVNIASIASFEPVPYGSVYAATKAYVLSFSRALNREWKKKGVRVLAVCPYWTKTAFFDRSNKKGVITRFGCMYDPAFIARRTLRAMKKGRRDYIVPGATAKATRAAAKLLPHSLVISVFLRQQHLHR